MGIDVCQWRARIGLFTHPMSKVKCPAILSVRTNNLHLTMRLTLLFSVVLLLCGDIEANPGPRTQDSEKSDRPGTRSFSQSTLHQNWEKGNNSSDIGQTLLEIKTQMMSISQGLNDVKTEMSSVKNSVEQLNQKLDNNIEKLEHENKSLKLRVSNLESQVEKFEAIHRKNNLIFIGIDDNITNDNNEPGSTVNTQNSDGTKESWSDCERKIRKFICTVLNMGTDFADGVKIENVYRIQGSGKNRPMIVNFLSNYDRNIILKQAKKCLRIGDKFRVNEDFSPKVKTARKNLSPFLLEARERGCKVSMRYDKLMIDSKLYTYDDESNGLKELPKR